MCRGQRSWSVRVGHCHVVVATVLGRAHFCVHIIMWYFRFLGWLGEQSKFEGHRRPWLVLYLYIHLYTQLVPWDWRVKGQLNLLEREWRRVIKLQSVAKLLGQFAKFWNLLDELRTRAKKICRLQYSPPPPLVNVDHSSGMVISCLANIVQGGGGGDVLPGVGILKNSQKMVKRPNSFATDCTLGSVIHCGSLSTQPITTEGTR